METDLDPLQWGWKMKQGRMTPIMTDKVDILTFTISFRFDKFKQVNKFSDSRGIYILNFVNDLSL